MKFSKLMGTIYVFLKNRGVQFYPMHPSNGDPEYAQTQVALDKLQFVAFFQLSVSKDDKVNC